MLSVKSDKNRKAVTEQRRLFGHPNNNNKKKTFPATAEVIGCRKKEGNTNHGYQTTDSIRSSTVQKQAKQENKLV